MSEWVHHFSHFILQVFVRWYTFLGTSPGGVAAQTVTLFLSEGQGGWWRVSSWRTNWQGGLRRGIIALGSVWIIVFCGCIVTTVYEDHEYLVAQAREAKSGAKESAQKYEAEIKNLQDALAQKAKGVASRNAAISVKYSLELVDRLHANFAALPKGIVMVFTHTPETKSGEDDLYAMVLAACQTAGADCVIEPGPSESEVDTGIPSPIYSGLVIHADDAMPRLLATMLTQALQPCMTVHKSTKALPQAVLRIMERAHRPESAYVWFEFGTQPLWTGACL